MNKIFAGVDAGRKNIGFGLVLFLILGVLGGIPLTVDLMGGSLLSASQYQALKVLHAYGVFLAFVNFFFGYCVDRLNLTRPQKELSSWLFVIAGLFGGIGRSILFLAPLPGVAAGYIISFIETAGFAIGTFIFLRGQLQQRPAPQP